MTKVQEPLSHRQETARRAISVVGAEAAGLDTSMGALLIAKSFAGPQMEKAKEWAATSVILPLLNNIESVRHRLGRDQVEDPNALEKLPPDERARKLANSLVDFSIMFPAGVAVRLGVQSLVDEKLGVPVEDKRQYVFSKVVDTSVAAATMVGMNSIGRGPAKVSATALSGMFSKMGMPQETAESLGKFMIYMQVPNAAGMLANIATLNQLNKKIDGPGLSR